MAEGRGFEGLPLAARRDELKAGVAVVELASGFLVSMLEFTAGVHETFDVQFLPGLRCPAICGPFPSRDGSQPVWIVPDTWRKRLRELALNAATFSQLSQTVATPKWGSVSTQKGISLPALEKVLGHDRLPTIEICLNLTDRHNQEEYEQKW